MEELYEDANGTACALNSNYKTITWITSFLVLICFNSCVPVDDLIYLQDVSNTTEKIQAYNHSDYRLQINDILDVKISSLNADVNEIFNSSEFGTLQFAQATAQTGGDLYYATGYSVNQAGLIDIPFVGMVDVVGLTLNEARLAIDARVGDYFSNYHLQVKLGGVRFSTLGEFNRPGKHVIMQNQATIFEAIAMSGDLNMVANRKNIKLVRQYPSGTRVHTLNLLTADVIESPLYFIQPNDVIYAEPLPQKSWGIGITGSQTLGTLVSTLSTSLALILSIVSLSQ